MTPLWVIALFVSLTEVVTGIAVTQANGSVQVALTVFVIAFPVLVASAFFAVLWHRPYVFYPPTEFGAATDVEKFVGAMRPMTLKADMMTIVVQAVSKSLAPEDERPPVEELVRPLVNTVSKKTEEGTPIPVEKSVEGSQTAAADSFDWLERLRAKDYDGAIASLRTQIEALSGEREKVRLESFVGHVLMERDYATGISHYEELILRAPDHPLPYLWYGLTYHWDKSYTQAIAVYERGLARSDVQAASLLVAKGEALAKLGRRKEAISAFELAIADYPNDVDNYADLAVLYAEENDTEGALRWYRAGLLINPKSQPLLERYAAYLAEMPDRRPEAVLRYTTLIEISPDNTTYRTRFGNVLVELGLNDAALECYLKANDLAGGKEAWILANIGNLYNNRALYSQAIKYLQDALKADSTSEYAHDRLASALRLHKEELKKLEAVISKARESLAPNDLQPPHLEQPTTT